MEKRRRRKKKKDPAERYLKMKESEELPFELKIALRKKDQLSKVHLVSIYGISGEKELREHRRQFAELKTRSQSTSIKARMML
jgi:hypothetical protein